jgi:hypothetical protein
MVGFFRKRNFAGTTVVVLVLLLAAVCEARLSYSFTFGALDGLVDHDNWTVGMMAARLSLMAAMLILWLFNRPRMLHGTIVLFTGFLTLGVAASTAALVEALVGPVSQVAHFFIVDVVLLAITNVLVFSLWYWIIDPPGILSEEGHDDPWEFLFPQRDSDRPQDADWMPGYIEYLYLSFVISLTFSPPDIIPLSRRAKMLVMLQISLSVVIITVIAANVIGALQSS